MEKVILKGKQYRNLVQETEMMMKMIFYNMDYQILLYQYHNELYIPTITANSKEEFVPKLYEMTHIQFDPNIIEELIGLLTYDFIFEAQNNKLRKKYFEHIKEFYTCMISFDQQFTPISTLQGNLYPTIMSPEDAIHQLEKVKLKKINTLYGLKAFQQKVKENTIC